MLARLASGLVLVLFAVVAACNGNIDERAAVAGGTPAPDGSDGYCCPARTGGCALTGGYRTEGECPKDFDICDNMCEQRIVKDEHGCDTLTYKTPPVTTTYASPGSCSSPVFNGGGRDAGRDADASADTGTDSETTDASSD